MPFAAFAVYAMRGRWFALFAAILAMAVGGGAYVFAVYSNAMKTSLGYDQKTLRDIAFFKNLGASLGVLPGILHEVAPAWVVQAVGAATNLLGYLMAYLAVSGRTARPPAGLMCFYIAVAANSQSFASTGALVTTVINFPDDRGLVVGLLMGFAGLSGAILTHLHRAFAGAEDGAALLLLLTSLPTAVVLLFILSIHIMIAGSGDGPTRGERRGILGFLGVSVVVALYLVVLNVVELKVPLLPRSASYITAMLVLVAILLFCLLAVVFVQERRSYVQPTAAPTSASATREAPAAGIGNTNPPSSFFQDVFRPPARGQDYTILQALFSADMLLLFIAAGCGIGGMLTVIDNMGLIGQALGYKQDTVSMLVSLVSLSNYAGRVVAGLGSDLVVERYKLPRPLALTVTLLLAAVGHLLIALGVRDGLYAAALIIGFCFGAQWTVLFTIVSEVFGLRHFSALCNWATLATPVGCYVLNVLVTGHLYDTEVRRQARPDQNCIGVRCFQESFSIIAGVAVLGAFVSVLLVRRTRAFYVGRHGTAAVGPADV